MASGKFTISEQIKILQNPYVLSVTESSIIYSSSFKYHFIKEYRSGRKALEIFIDAGFDPDIIGEKRIEQTAYRWRSTYNESQFIIDPLAVKGEQHKIMKRFCTWAPPNPEKKYLFQTSCNHTHYLQESLLKITKCPFCGKFVHLQEFRKEPPFSFEELLEQTTLIIKRELLETESETLKNLYDTIPLKREEYIKVLRKTLEQTGTFNTYYLKLLVEELRRNQKEKTIWQITH